MILPGLSYLTGRDEYNREQKVLGMEKDNVRSFERKEEKQGDERWNGITYQRERP